MRRAGHAEEATQYSLRITVENRERLTEAQCENGACGGAAYSGQFHQRVETIRQLAPKICANALRGAVQIARACVIAKPRPQMQDIVNRSRGQALHVGKTRDEALVVRH